jgi:hypothetical protein
VSAFAFGGDGQVSEGPRRVQRGQGLSDGHGLSCVHLDEHKLLIWIDEFDDAHCDGVVFGFIRIVL